MIGAITALAVLALIVLSFRGHELQIIRQSDQQVIARYELPDQARFSITFIHSVNQSPVEDIFYNDRGTLKSDRTIYYDFGAGVQSELEQGDVLEQGSDGEIIIRHAPKTYDDLNYIVGTVSDHVLEIDDQTISLRELCGQNTAITFRLR